MESNKLGKKIQDWAANLGFTLPDGSAPFPNHFALLTATPHRRQLWETLVDSIQPRHKILQMRKQILVAKLQERKKYLKKNTLKQTTDRFDLWQKQNTFETDVKEKRNAVVKLERNVMTKASDSLFEICKLAELEKLLEDVSQKAVVLKLIIKRNKKIREELERRLSKVKTDFDVDLSKLGGKESLSIEKVLNTEECKCLSSDSHNCELSSQIENFCQSCLTQQNLWEEVIEFKKRLLDKFSEFLVEINTSERNHLGEKEREIEKKLSTGITQLKQKTTEKSLQMIINSKKGKLLEAEAERLEERLLEEIGAAPLDPTFNESFSFLSCDTSKPSDENEKSVKNMKNYLRVLELQKYEEFLKEELKRLEEEMMKSSNQEENWKDSKKGEEIELSLKAFDEVVKEINWLKSEEERLKREIFREHVKVESLLHLVKEEMEGKTKTRKENVEEVAEKVKSASKKQIDLLLETPLDVFKTIETSGRVLFECESASHFSTNYGGEFKQLLSAMLILPVGETQEILREVERRKRVLEEMKKRISEREDLSQIQKEIQHRLSSIKHETGSWEKNLKDADGILWNVLSKTEELLREVDFIDKILNHWVEQPYRSIIKETTWGKDLKEIEEKYSKGKTE